MNTRDIKAVKFWTPDGSKSATKILLYNFHGYDFNGSDSMVSYKLVTADDQSLMENSVAIPDEVIQQWGENDEPIFDYVIGKLNLTKVE